MSQHLSGHGLAQTAAVPKASIAWPKAGTPGGTPDCPLSAKDCLSDDASAVVSTLC